VRYYQRIVDYLKNEESLAAEEAERRRSLLLAAHLNLAMCHLKLSENVDACRCCDDALSLDPQSEKGLFRRGMVLLFCDITTTTAILLLLLLLLVSLDPQSVKGKLLSYDTFLLFLCQFSPRDKTGLPSIHLVCR